MNRLVTVANPEGLHMRVALLISECAKKYNATVTITKDSETVSARDILQVLTLGATPGVTLTVDAQGDQASEALNDICALFENNVKTSL